MYVVVPFCKPTKVVPDFTRVGVEYVGPVFLNSQAVLVHKVIDVATDLRPFFDDEDIRAAGN